MPSKKSGPYILGDCYYHYVYLVDSKHPEESGLVSLDTMSKKQYEAIVTKDIDMYRKGCCGKKMEDKIKDTLVSPRRSLRLQENKHNEIK
jgi:hypothetical protein